MIIIPVFSRKTGIFFVIRREDRLVPGQEDVAWKIIDK